MRVVNGIYSAQHVAAFARWRGSGFDSLALSEADVAAIATEDPDSGRHISKERDAEAFRVVQQKAAAARSTAPVSNAATTVIQSHRSASGRQSGLGRVGASEW